MTDLFRRPGLLIWSVAFAVCLALVLLAPQVRWIASFPRALQLPLADWLNAGLNPLFETVQPIGRGFATVIDAPLRLVRDLLLFVPWPAFAVAMFLVALRTAGRGLAIFGLIAQLYIVAVGYWTETMNTFAIVLLSLPPAVLIGFGLGVAGHRWPRLRAALIVVLDLMQTFPAFAYLIPLLILFGFGPSAGVIASVIFSIPPMARNTLVGLREVPAVIIEAGVMNGATPGQLFWTAKLPAAARQLLVGVNQTTMASLSMVIIVAIIGGFNDIGWEVLSAMRAAELGRCLLAGVVIVALAIVLDRITGALATGTPRGVVLMPDRGLLTVVAAILLAGIGLRLALPGLELLPRGLGFAAAKALDRSLLQFVGWSDPVFSGLRDALNYGIILPLRIGLATAASPMVWGFALQPWMVAAYAILTLALAVVLAPRRPAAALLILFAALILYTGLARFPWPCVVLIALLAAWRIRGVGLLAVVSTALAMILLSGLWQPFVQSLYLTAIAVLFCVLIGGAIGIAAAENDRLSQIVRPISDALQTLPQFVFLIPALMLFRVGEFTALIAIMLYAIVPPVRYVEHGLRGVPPHLVEAAVQMGVSRWQLLRDVKLPLAGPAIRLGVNQTIMYAISMLVIAALVGTRDLGQQVYIALGNANAGLGFVAGLSIALLAIVADRMLRRN
ncbi:ABC transporter permease [Pseudodonghicola flavimaris]|uniref:ABC transporter permease subunit n=1 Tax=Pseudodonghicola flavimaris TaxID=3050036 RepID=A0ABT7F8D6_9RHOB|nr:ABC transporter permease subunit [Pseudodonghicola flavimaris]MDK3020838.1 ABC transporter permease subunit [Pseudodonghicola flavimaris]